VTDKALRAELRPLWNERPSMSDAGQGMRVRLFYVTNMIEIIQRYLGIDDDLTWNVIGTVED
jgi:hypothetical protein